MFEVNDSTPISMLTVGQLWELFEKRFGKHALSSRSNSERSTGRLVYGLKGVADLFGCSHKTAQYYKDHVIREAVSQNGRKIVVDADLALKLFNERRAK